MTEPTDELPSVKAPSDDGCIGSGVDTDGKEYDDYEESRKIFSEHSLEAYISKPLTIHFRGVTVYVTALVIGYAFEHRWQYDEYMRGVDDSYAEVVKMAAAQEDFSHLDYLCHNYDGEWDMPITARAVAYGTIDVFNWILDCDAPLHQTPLVCREVASTGDLARLQLCHDMGLPWTASTCDAAARCGRLEMLQWLRDKKCPWGVMTCRFAARGGYFDIVQWAITNGCPWDKDWVPTEAARSGHLPMLQWLAKEGGRLSSHVSAAAANRGNVEMMRWLLAQQCPRDHRSLHKAVRQGSLDLLCLLLTQGDAWDAESAVIAAAFGHIHILNYARNAGYDLGSVCRASATVGRFDIFAWAHTNGVCNHSPNCEWEYTSLLRYMASIHWIVSTSGSLWWYTYHRKSYDGLLSGGADFYRYISPIDTWCTNVTFPTNAKEWSELPQKVHTFIDELIIKMPPPIRLPASPRYK